MNDGGAPALDSHLDEPLWDELDLPGIGTAPQVTIRGMDAFEEPARTIETAVASSSDNDGAAARERIIRALGPAPIELDDVMRAASTSLRNVHATLLDLELEGRIERHGGNRVSARSQPVRRLGLRHSGQMRKPVERALQDEGRRRRIYHDLPLLPAHVAGKKLALGRHGGQTLIPEDAGQRRVRRERAHEGPRRLRPRTFAAIHG